MRAKQKVQKTIWIARQGLGSDWDEYCVYVGKHQPKFEEVFDYWGDTKKGTALIGSGVTQLCASEWHRATGIRLKRGEVARIKVSVVK